MCVCVWREVAMYVGRCSEKDVIRGMATKCTNKSSTVASLTGGDRRRPMQMTEIA